jgi:hypothetical protein
MKDIKIVIDNADRDGIGNDTRIWTANAYEVDSNGQQTLLSDDTPGFGDTIIEAVEQLIDNNTIDGVGY